MAIRPKRVRKISPYVQLHQARYRNSCLLCRKLFWASGKFERYCPAHRLEAKKLRETGPRSVRVLADGQVFRQIIQDAED